MLILPQNESKVNVQSNSAAQRDALRGLIARLESHARRGALRHLGQPGFITGSILSQPQPQPQPKAQPPPGAVLKFAPGGVVVKRKLAPTSIPVRHKRGVVRGMSGKSRRRLRERLVGVDWGAILPGGDGRSKRASMLTLTYPSEFPTDHLEYKAHFKALMMRLTRSFPVVGALWRLEHQQRGAAHFHVIVVFERDIDIKRFREWASRSWYAVVGSGDERHLRAGTNVRALHGPVGRLMRYLTKYVSKPDGGRAEQTGRVWGIWGELPDGDTLVIELSWERWVQFSRRLRRWGRHSRYIGRINSSSRGALIYGGRDQLGQLLRGLWTEFGPVEIVYEPVGVTS